MFMSLFVFSSPLDARATQQRRSALGCVRECVASRKRVCAILRMRTVRQCENKHAYVIVFNTIAVHPRSEQRSSVVWGRHEGFL